MSYRWKNDTIPEVRLYNPNMLHLSFDVWMNQFVHGNHETKLATGIQLKLSRFSRLYKPDSILTPSFQSIVQATLYTLPDFNDVQQVLQFESHNEIVETQQRDFFRLMMSIQWPTTDDKEERLKFAQNVAFAIPAPLTWFHDLHAGAQVAFSFGKKIAAAVESKNQRACIFMTFCLQLKLADSLCHQHTPELRGVHILSLDEMDFVHDAFAKVQRGGEDNVDLECMFIFYSLLCPNELNNVLSGKHPPPTASKFEKTKRV